MITSHSIHRCCFVYVAVAVMVPVCFGASASGGLVINEVLYDASSNDGTTGSNGEWIELYNDSATATDVTNYVLTDGDWSIVLPSQSIGAYDYFLIGYASTASDLNGSPTFDVDLDTYSSSMIGGATPLTLTNKGEFLGLFDASGTLIDGVVWESPSTNNTPGQGSSASVALSSGHPLGGTLTIPTTGFTSIAGNAGNGESIARNLDGTGTWVFSSTMTGGNTAGRTNVTPEPASLSLGSLAVALLFMTSSFRRRRRQVSGTDSTTMPPSRL